MKKYISMTLTVALLGLTACTEDAFDRINKDYEHPSPEAVPAFPFPPPFADSSFSSVISSSLSVFKLNAANSSGVK